MKVKLLTGYVLSLVVAPTMVVMLSGCDALDRKVVEANKHKINGVKMSKHEWDGHTWAVYGISFHGSVSHHPDCLCNKD